MNMICTGRRWGFDASKRLTSRLEQGCGRRHSLRHFANLANKHAGGYDFDGHRGYRDQKFGGEFRSEQLARGQHTIADHRYDQGAGRRSAQKKETTKLYLVCRIEGWGDRMGSNIGKA